MSVRRQRAIAYRRPNDEDVAGDLFSKSVTLEPPRTNSNIEEGRMNKSLRSDEGVAGECELPSPEVDWFEAQNRFKQPAYAERAAAVKIRQ
jgi:hypothetical protein